MSTLEIVELVIISLIVLGFIIWFLVNGIKNGWIKKLANTISETMHKAEESGASSEEKKKMVMDAIEAKCEELGIPYYLMKTVFSKLVDLIVKHKNVVDKGGNL